jgi:hypothetical protein
MVFQIGALACSQFNRFAVWQLHAPVAFETTCKPGDTRYLHSL